MKRDPLLIVAILTVFSMAIFSLFFVPVSSVGCTAVTTSHLSTTAVTTIATPTTTTKPTTTTTEATKPKIVPVYDYTEQELDLLARLIYSEGGNVSYTTQLMIGSVVMNRVSSPDNFPDTLKGVIYQENQFSVTTIKIGGVIMIDRPADEEAKKAAYEVLTYGSILPSNVQVFYEKSIKTGWVASREPYKVSDNIQFSYIYKRGDFK